MRRIMRITSSEVWSCFSLKGRKGKRKLEELCSSGSKKVFKKSTVSAYMLLYTFYCVFNYHRFNIKRHCIIVTEFYMIGNTNGMNTCLFKCKVYLFISKNFT